jgi:uncharacterized delta-60 repeat protein
MLQALREVFRAVSNGGRGRTRIRRGRTEISLWTELAEIRTLLSSHSLIAVADGTVADRNLDGQFETSISNGTSILDRWFSAPEIGEERGVFEFDLTQFAPGSTVLSAKIGLNITSFTSGSGLFPTLQFSASLGDGVITASDGHVAANAAGSASITTTGDWEIPLTASVIGQFIGSNVSLRMANSALSGHWVSVSSSEVASRIKPTLILEVAAPTLAVSVNPATLSEDGSQTAVGTVSRTGDLAASLVVTLISTDTSEATVPASVTIPAGMSSAQFTVTAVDDAILDGSQEVQILANSTLTDGSAPFGLDSSFGTGGIATTNLTAAIQPPDAAIAVLPDGKILVASEATTTSWKISRYNANGSIDTSFGTGGTTTTSLTSATYPVPFRIVVQPDGKILVGGKYSGGVGSAALVRYTAAGVLDTTFGVGGRADLANVGGWIEDIAVRPDGRILLAISFNGTIYFRVAGLTSAGILDSTFGVKTYTSINASVKSIELLSDGRFILAGSKVVARFTATGSLDTTFGTNGTTRFTFTAPAGGEIFDAKIDAQNRIVLGMSTYVFVNSTATNHNFATARLTPEGGFDSTYANGGIRSVDFGGLTDFPAEMMLQSDQKLVMGGFTETAANVRDLAMVRFDTNGELDPSFDGDGRYQRNLIVSNGEMIVGVAQQANGKLLALGGFGNDFRLLQFHPGASTLRLDASANLTVTDNEIATYRPVIAPQSFQIAENSETGTDVGSVVASDPDPGQTLSFALTSASVPRAFSLNPSTGLIEVADSSLLNHEAVSSVTLTVTVTDSGDPALSSSNTMTISITDINETPVVADQDFWIDENAANGTVVGTVTAVDPDNGQTLTWTATGGGIADALAVNPATGQITVVNSSLLNYEAISDFSLRVTVTDNASLPASAAAYALIHLRNINEAPVVIPGNATVTENASNGTHVASILVTDEDAGGANVTYALTSSTVPGAFSVDSQTGLITVADSSLLNFEQVSSATLIVSATEIGTSLTGTGTVHISLNDVNEHPVISNAAFSIAENSPNGSTVGTVSASDVDAGQNLTYSLNSSSLPGALTINSATGRISVADSSLLDYEAVSSITLSISVADNGDPSLSASATVTVSVTNGNESPTISDAAFSVREYLNGGLLAGAVTASDPDAGQTLRYSITNTTLPGAFYIDMQTGEIKASNSQLLDYETVTSVTLTVTVSDNGAPQLSDSATVVISINDVNESPVAISPTYTVPELAANGVLGTVSASDVDQGQTLTWEIFNSPVPGAFAINAGTGVLSIVDGSLLNFESRPSMQLAILVSDNGTPVLATFAVVTINLTDVNEAPVVANRSFSINENTANGSAVGNAAATDPDAGQTISWSIDASSLPGAFAINPSTGSISVGDSSLLDYEAVTSVTLMVTATDSASPSLSASGLVTINLRNLNEAPQASDQSFSVAENAANGTVVGQFVASDVDAGQSLFYSITGNPLPGAFQINPGTGEITVGNTQLLNHEANPTVTLTVRVTDNGVPGLFTSSTVTISVTDVNEAPNASNQLFFLNENSTNGAMIGDVVASDVDAGQSLTYQIVSTTLPGAIAIDPDTGRLTVASNEFLNYEALTRITLNVAVTDNGNPALSSTGVVWIEINNVNDAPVIGDQSFSLNENTLNGTQFGRVTGTDQDFGQSLSWAITSSSLPGAFSVLSSTGGLYVADASLLNYEAVTSVTLLVTATDNGSPALTGSGAITISIQNVNERPTISAQSFFVAENSANGGLIGTVAASDVDAGQTLMYQISSSTLAGAISINSATGQLTVANSALLNFESVTQINLVVNVTDNGSPSLSNSQNVTINITNVNEAPTISGKTVSLAENSTNGTLVTSVSGSDVDAGQSLSYSIAAGNTGGAFAINATTGQITVANMSAVDFETTPVFNLTVRVTDNGNPALSGSAIVTVNLTDVAEAKVVAIDVVPGDSTNTFRRTAKFEVAILSTSTFDARQVNVSSVRFGKQGTEDSLVRDKKGNRIFSYRDVNGDGRLDLVVQVNGGSTGLAVGDTLAKLTGLLQSGESFFGSSAVIVRR